MRIFTVTLAIVFSVTATVVSAGVGLINQSIAEASLNLRNEDILTFYRQRGFEPVWIGPDASERRRALAWATSTAGDHGLPEKRYDLSAIETAFSAARTSADLGRLDVQMSHIFLNYARDVSVGFLSPRSIDDGMVLKKPAFDAILVLNGIANQDDPFAFVHSLWPQNPIYDGLLREMHRLVAVQEQGGWGPPVRARRLEFGDQGPQVLNLRNRLIRMGYLSRTAAATFDEDLEDAVRAFQIDQGYNPDGIVGPATLSSINASVEDRLGQVLVGLERQRWMNKPLEPRHVFVNLAEFRAYVVDHGNVTFETGVVVGANEYDRRTPEFSDEMTYMVINPTWHVPRSIAVKEYLPELQTGGARHLRLFSDGKQIDPGVIEQIDFTQFDEETFPFDLKQAPSRSNALGLVKFMFPNRWNIYLHDTPQKRLFNRDIRTFSHGCIRVARPFELAYHLLAPQEADPEAAFNRVLRRGKEEYVYLEQPIGVHLVYWTAWVDDVGRIHFREDVYGRDAKILRAMRAVGVDIPQVAS